MTLAALRSVRTEWCECYSAFPTLSADRSGEALKVDFEQRFAPYLVLKHKVLNEVSHVCGSNDLWLWQHEPLILLLFSRLGPSSVELMR